MAEGSASSSGRARPTEFHPDADAEMRAAARYYDHQRAGLGDLFLAEVEQALAFVAAQPTAGAALGEGFRWALLRRFRHAVIYRERAEAIEVVAVAHLKRRPGYWRDRM